MADILILGGTNFIGRRLVERLLKNPELNITLFNRGKTNDSLFPNCRKIMGDREIPADLEPLFVESWDYVIDLSCYYPNSLRTITRKMNPNTRKYIFISTCSVYDNDGYEGMLRNERAPVLIGTEEEQKDSSLATYGKRKAACEAILTASKLPYIILRPALVYGPYDGTDRLYYWIYASKMGKEFILPENGERQFSVTYVDDLVQGILLFLENAIQREIYHCISHTTISIAEIVAAAAEILEQEMHPVSMDAEFLKNEKVSEWFDLPLWLHTDSFTFANEALEKDTHFKSLDFKKSMQHTIQDYQEKGFPTPHYGMDGNQQRRLIRKYKNNE